MTAGSSSSDIVVRTPRNGEGTFKKLAMKGIYGKWKRILERISRSVYDTWRKSVSVKGVIMSQPPRHFLAFDVKMSTCIFQ